MKYSKALCWVSLRSLGPPQRALAFSTAKLSRPSTTAVQSMATSWTACPSCRGQGKFQRPPTRKARARYQRQGETPPPRIEPCTKCQTTGLVDIASVKEPQPEYDLKIAIVGGGLAGWALAAACRHRRFREVTLFERDEHFEERSQSVTSRKRRCRQAAAIGAFGK